MMKRHRELKMVNKFWGKQDTTNDDPDSPMNTPMDTPMNTPMDTSKDVCCWDDCEREATMERGGKWYCGPHWPLQPCTQIIADCSVCGALADYYVGCDFVRTFFCDGHATDITVGFNSSHIVHGVECPCDVCLSHVQQHTGFQWQWSEYLRPANERECSYPFCGAPATHRTVGTIDGKEATTFTCSPHRSWFCDLPPLNGERKPKWVNSATTTWRRCSDPPVSGCGALCMFPNCRRFATGYFMNTEDRARFVCDEHTVTKDGRWALRKEATPATDDDDDQAASSAQLNDDDPWAALPSVWDDEVRATIRLITEARAAHHTSVELPWEVSNDTLDVLNDKGYEVQCMWVPTTYKNMNVKHTVVTWPPVA